MPISDENEHDCVMARLLVRAVAGISPEIMTLEKALRLEPSSVSKALVACKQFCRMSFARERGEAQLAMKCINEQCDHFVRDVACGVVGDDLRDAQQAFSAADVFPVLHSMLRACFYDDQDSDTRLPIFATPKAIILSTPALVTTAFPKLMQATVFAKAVRNRASIAGCPVSSDALAWLLGLHGLFFCEWPARVHANALSADTRVLNNVVLSTPRLKRVAPPGMHHVLLVALYDSL